MPGSFVLWLKQVSTELAANLILLSAGVGVPVEAFGARLIANALVPSLASSVSAAPQPKSPGPGTVTVSAEH